MKERNSPENIKQDCDRYAVFSSFSIKFFKNIDELHLRKYNIGEKEKDFHLQPSYSSTLSSALIHVDDFVS